MTTIADFQNEQFFKDLVISLRSAVGSKVVVNPLVASGSFVLTLDDRYWDISKPTNVYTSVPSTVRSLLAGNLYLKNYCNTFGAVAGNVDVSLVQSDSLANTFQVERRNITAADTTWGLANEFKYNPISFSTIRTQRLGGFDGQYTINYSFFGVQITY